MTPERKVKMESDLHEGCVSSPFTCLSSSSPKKFRLWRCKPPKQRCLQSPATTHRAAARSTVTAFIKVTPYTCKLYSFFSTHHTLLMSDRECDTWPEKAPTQEICREHKWPQDLIFFATTREKVKVRLLLYFVKKNIVPHLNCKACHS